MWRIHADVEFEESTKKERYNPFKDESESQFFAKYRFSKLAFGDLFDIISPALERRTSR
jgi:hypothetical protein